MHPSWGPVEPRQVGDAALGALDVGGYPPGGEPARHRGAPPRRVDHEAGPQRRSVGEHHSPHRRRACVRRPLDDEVMGRGSRPLDHPRLGEHDGPQRLLDGGAPGGEGHQRGIVQRGVVDAREVGRQAVAQRQLAHAVGHQGGESVGGPLRQQEPQPGEEDVAVMRLGRRAPHGDVPTGEPGQACRRGRQVALDQHHLPARAREEQRAGESGDAGADHDDRPRLRAGAHLSLQGPSR